MHQEGGVVNDHNRLVHDMVELCTKLNGLSDDVKHGSSAIWARPPTVQDLFEHLSGCHFPGKWTLSASFLGEGNKVARQPKFGSKLVNKPPHWGGRC